MEDNPYPIQDEDENYPTYIARVQAWKAKANANLLRVPTLPPKVCVSCHHSNGAAAKKCSQCDHNLGLSMGADAVKSRKRRAAATLAKKEAARLKCSLCQGFLAKGNKALGISLCVQSSTDEGQTTSIVVPCGRQMHLKCLEANLKASTVRNGDFGLQQNKCANCQQKTSYPHYVKIYGP